MESGWKGRSRFLYSFTSKWDRFVDSMIKEWFPRSWNTYTLRDLHLSWWAIRFHDEWTSLEKRRAKLRSKDTLRTFRHGTPANEVCSPFVMEFFSRPAMVNFQWNVSFFENLRLFEIIDDNFFLKKISKQRKTANVRFSSLVSSRLFSKWNF